jgi:hypothetical protein
MVRSSVEEDGGSERALFWQGVRDLRVRVSLSCSRSFGWAFQYSPTSPSSPRAEIK